MKIKLLFWCVMLLITMSLNAQSIGDYRSNVSTSGNWNVLASWERWNGTTWSIPTAGEGWPGQNAGTGTVTILNGDTIVLNTSVTSNFTELIIGEGATATSTFFGVLLVNGDYNLNTLDITISRYGEIQFNKTKSSLILPQSAGIKIIAPGKIDTDGSCNNNVAIYIGTVKFAVCAGAGNAEYSFDDLNNSGGTFVVEPSSPSPVCESNDIVLSGELTTPELKSNVDYTWLIQPPTGASYSISGSFPKIAGKTTPYTIPPHTISSAQVGTYVATLTCSTSFGSVTFSNSETMNIVVNAKPTAPSTVITPLSVCTDNTGNITINTSGFGAGHTYSIDGINYINTTGFFDNLPAGSYNVTVKNASGCVSSVSLAEIVAVATTKWNGTSWSNGLPTDGNKIIQFEGNYSEIESLSGCSCEVISGDVVITDKLILVNALKVSGGTLTLKDKSSLMQATDVQNTGNIVYERETNINRFDYTYYSSPVSSQTLVGVSPETLSDKFLSFDGVNSAWVYENKNTTMTIGKGYVIRGPQSYHNTTRALFTAKFTGVPNNGPVNGENVIATKSYIVGNPYPSAIKISDFLAGNPFLEGTVRFWTHNTNIAPSGSSYVYSSTDYASCNATGCVRAESLGVMPNGYIAAGQSVLVKVQAAVSPSQITFNNGMRESELGNNSVFFKLHKADKSAISENKIWLNLANSEGIFKQALVGYVIGATNSYENKFDGITSNANANADFYSISDEKNLSIQGRAYPIDITDSVLLGYKSMIEGNLSISIDHSQGDFSTQFILLEDKMLNVVHDLKVKPYTFATLKGAFKDRFVLKYTKYNYDSNLNKTDANGVLVSVKDKIINITNTSENIKQIYLYNISGVLLYKNEGVNTKQFSIDQLPSFEAVLLVKIILENGAVSARKIIF